VSDKRRSVSEWLDSEAQSIHARIHFRLTPDERPFDVLFRIETKKEPSGK